MARFKRWGRNRATGGLEAAAAAEARVQSLAAVVLTTVEQQGLWHQ